MSLGLFFEWFVCKSLLHIDLDAIAIGFALLGEKILSDACLSIIHVFVLPLLMLKTCMTLV